MKRNKMLGLFLACQLLCVVAWGQGAYKIEPINAPPSADVPKTLQDALQGQGTRVLDDKGTPVCEVWLRKAVPTQQSATGSSDILYGNLTVGTLVGVLHFPQAGSDFRGQTIKRGFYTLRYAQIPQDGNHMGVSTYRDFVLLSPAAADTTPDPVMKFDDLLKLSRQASGTAHPAVISLDPVKQGASSSMFQDDQGHWALQVELDEKAAAGERTQRAPIAIIVVGKAEAE